MSILETIKGPRDLDHLTDQQMIALAAEIRRFLVTEVSKTGGHLGPNLGVVELTLAMHRVFESRAPTRRVRSRGPTASRGRSSSRGSRTATSSRWWATAPSPAA